VPLMVVMGVLLLLGLTLTALWGGWRYRSWPSPPSAGAGDAEGQVPSLGTAALRYLRGVAVALVGGFWAGALVTGPAMRLIMRLLAVTAGDAAQGRLTEANEVVGDIDLEGTVGLYVFGGIFPGLLSGAIYVLARPWLPRGRAGGLVFGALHLVLAATRVDPLRPENPDFGIVGPGWLSVATFGAAAVVHGMAVAAFANRFSTAFPPPRPDASARVRSVLPLTVPVLFLIPGAFLLVPIALGLLLGLAVLKVEGGARIARNRTFLVAGRVVIAVLALALLPGTLTDLWDVLAGR
jgi:hypothetical protein